jgi:GT2 family glycosyltransferase
MEKNKSPKVLRHPELVSGSQDHEMLKQVQHDDRRVVPKVYIVTPIHNGLDYTREFLRTVERNNYPDFKIIIVDDGSTDGSAEFISQNHPEVIILKADGNFWWTKATNLGVQYAIDNDADYILTVNNDVELDTNLISELVNCAVENPGSLVGAKVYSKSEPNKVNWGGGKINPPFKSPHFLTLPFGSDDKNYQKIREVDFLTGMGCLIPVEVFKKFGLFNEKYLPHYCADTELSVRAQKQGYKLLFCPEAFLFNNTQSSWREDERLKTFNIKNILFHVKSPYLIKANVYFYLTTYPNNLGLIAFAYLYTTLTFRILMNLLPGGKYLLRKIIKDKNSYA